MNKTELGSEPFCSLGRTDNKRIFVPRGPSLGLERSGREFYHSVLSSVQVKNESRYMLCCIYVYIGFKTSFYVVLHLGQWEERKQWSLGVGQRRTNVDA